MRAPKKGSSIVNQSLRIVPYLWTKCNKNSRMAAIMPTKSQLAGPVYRPIWQRSPSGPTALVWSTIDNKCSLLGHVTIVTEKLCAKWVPEMLTGQDKEQRMLNTHDGRQDMGRWYSTILRKPYNSEPYNFTKTEKIWGISLHDSEFEFMEHWTTITAATSCKSANQNDQKL